MTAPNPQKERHALSGMTFDVTVEIPKGQKNKYEVDHETAGSGWIGRSSPQRSIPPTMASSRGHSVRTAIRSTPWCSCRSRPFPAA